MNIINIYIIIWFIIFRIPRLYAFTSDNGTITSVSTHQEGMKEQNFAVEDKNQTLPETQSAVPATKKSTLNETAILDNGLNTDAVFRGFYVVLALGSIFVIYIGIKTFRLRRHRAASRYKVIATKGEDRESFFPLAAEDGEDEEIFNAATHQGYT